MTMATITDTTSTSTELTFLPLLCWLSPSFPIGSYAYSHGLEWAAEAGDVRDERTLHAWLHELLTGGVCRNDAILLCAAYRASEAQDLAPLGDINDLALALASGAELRLETAQQGRSFLDGVLAAWSSPRLEESAKDMAEIALPVALGLAAASRGIGLRPTVGAYVTAFMQNLISAAIRLAPIGQTAGQRVLARLMPEMVRVAEEALTLGLDDIGGSTFRADLGSLRHETQYTRLFRS